MNCKVGDLSPGHCQLGVMSGYLVCVVTSVMTDRFDTVSQIVAFFLGYE